MIEPRHLITNKMIGSLDDEEVLVFYMIVEQEHSLFDISQIQNVEYEVIARIVNNICRKLCVWRRRPEILRKAWRESIEYNLQKTNGP